VSRYVVYGAGAIGGTIAARLRLAGHQVVLVARGKHRDAITSAGLEYREPGESRRIAFPVIGAPEQLAWQPGDVAILATKTQDTLGALLDLVAAAGPATPVVCAQNGVENERLCARFFENVYGLYVLVPAAHLQDGVVEAYGNPLPGILDAGRYPSGADDVARAIAGDLSLAGFSSHPVAEIMRWKAAKLLANLANGIEAAWGTDVCEGQLYQLARAEGESCLTAAGIGFVAEDAAARRRGDLLRAATIGGRAIPGGSTWQTIARRQTRTEADFLNGEVAMLGRIHAIPTPVNSAIQEIVRNMAERGDPPGTVPISRYEQLCRRAP
jgi:2-dehydropantoate 2-reductase